MFMALDGRHYKKGNERGCKVVMGITPDDPRYLKLREDGFIVVAVDGLVFGYLSRRESVAIGAYGLRVRSPSAREIRVYRPVQLFEAKTNRS